MLHSYNRILCSNKHEPAQASTIAQINVSKHGGKESSHNKIYARNYKYVQFEPMEIKIRLLRDAYVEDKLTKENQEMVREK